MKKIAFILSAATAITAVVYLIHETRETERRDDEAVMERTNEIMEAERRMQDIVAEPFRDPPLRKRYRELVLKQDKSPLAGAELEEFNTLRECLVDKPARERDIKDKAARKAATRASP